MIKERFEDVVSRSVYDRGEEGCSRSTAVAASMCHEVLRGPARSSDADGSTAVSEEAKSARDDSAKRRHSRVH